MLYTLRPEGGALAAKYSYANGRGDVVAQANQGGTVTWTASYEAFGTRKLETGTNVDRQRANTKEEDPTGLLNEGFRYRDLETGTWLSRDPAGFVDGPNLYAYVQQNPWSAFDPDGLSGDKLTLTNFAYVFDFAASCIGAVCAGFNPVCQAEYQKAPWKPLDSIFNYTGKQGKSDASQNAVKARAEAGLALNHLAAMKSMGPKTTPRLEPQAPQVATGKASLNKPQVLTNKDVGDAWTKKISDARESMNGSAVREVTIKTNESGTKTRIDVASRDPNTGVPILDEGKASATAPLTPNQAKAFPELERSGGVVVGKGKAGFEGGTEIPPTKVNIIRPPAKEEK